MQGSVVVFRLGGSDELPWEFRVFGGLGLAVLQVNCLWHSQ